MLFGGVGIAAGARQEDDDALELSLELDGAARHGPAAGRANATGGAAAEGSSSFGAVFYHHGVDCSPDGTWDSRGEEKEAIGRAAAKIGEFASGGEYGVVGLVDVKLRIPPPSGYWFVGAQCGHPDTNDTSPVVILFNQGLFKFVKAIGSMSARVEWARLPYVGDGGKNATRDSGVAGYSKSESCTGADILMPYGYAGAVVEHIPSGQTICVLAGTFDFAMVPMAPAFKDAIRDAGCIGKPLLMLFDVGDNRDISVLVKTREWGRGSDPGADLPCAEGGDTSGCTCCFMRGAGDDQTTSKWDRIAVFTPDDSGHVKDFKVAQEYVCKGVFEHKAVSGTVVFGR